MEKRELSTNTIPPQKVKALNISSCDQVVTPACIQALYRYPNQECAQEGNNLGIYEENSTYFQRDMDLFFRNAFPKIPQGTQARNILLNGAEFVRNVTNLTASGVLESNLDFQLAWPIVYPQNITLLDGGIQIPQSANSIDDSNVTAQVVLTAEVLAGSLDTILDAIDGSYCELTGADKDKTKCGSFKRPNVLSISFGGSELEMPAREQTRLCQEFLKLGLRGTSVIIAAGDNGVAFRNSMTSKPFCSGPGQKLFAPSYLAACPYVTAVGASTIARGNTVRNLEVAALEATANGTVQFASGGGFSNRFARPGFQREAVASYLQSNPPPFKSYDARSEDIGANSGVFNSAGRAFPDVSALGDRILQTANGRFLLSAGTSASAPIFASLVNRINGERLKAGKKPVGFLNQAIYMNPDAFNDVVNGTNPGCGTVGFKAAKGWDPVTGLGTPDYPKLLDVFMKLP